MGCTYVTIVPISMLTDVNSAFCWFLSVCHDLVLKEHAVVSLWELVCMHSIIYNMHSRKVCDPVFGLQRRVVLIMHVFCKKQKRQLGKLKEINCVE